MDSFYIEVSKIEGEKTRKELTGLGIINKGVKIKQAGEMLLIPIISPVKGFGDIGKADFEIIEKEETPEQILGFSPAIEKIGDIAIIDRHEPDAPKIAEALIRQKKIKTVLVAQTPVGGEYRIRELSVLAGETRTETLYKENGCRYRIDLSKVYFTPRLATERARIADQIKYGDLVVDMFAGAGPFSILIAKKYPQAHVIAIDKNPDAIKYLRENARLNKVINLEIREGDARDICMDITGADHVIMNLPHSGLDFMEAALKVVRKGGFIHFYAISHEDELYNGLLLKINQIAKRLHLVITPVDKKIVRPYAPYQHNICIDFQVS
ncbi:MAG: class I SAM-dependent methyltransferase family protein [Candidatus Methanoperedens sp.]|nr:class I SAM-dependent methyltransferase family protein [Candidatus Methanoperedens sp.]